MKKKIFLGSMILAGCFVFCVNYSQAVGSTIIKDGTHITSPTIWKKVDSPYLIKGYVYVEAELIVEPGTIIKFEYKDSYHAGHLEVYNKFTALGTEEEKIIFTSGRDDSFGGDTNNDGGVSKPAPGDWWHIKFYNQQYSAEMKNVLIFYGGGTPNCYDGAVMINNSDNISIKKSEIKYCANNGILIINSQPTIEDNVIANNSIGVSSEGAKTPVISNNSILNNKTGAIVSSPLMYRLDAKNNWWGSRTGPYYKSSYGWPDNQNGKGNMITDGVYFNPWLGKDPNHARKPVILIPGIGGSVNWDVMIGDSNSDNWSLMSHTYDGIIEAFHNMGYEEGKDFFICYYDWRQKNADSAKDFLKPLIAKANTLNGTTKVNVVAHSMGGILARSYIQGDNYMNDVDNLIMIGTPNKGASDVYPVWEGGYIPKNWENVSIMRSYVNYLDVKKLTLSDFQSVHKYIPSVKELMPLYDYIHPKGDSQNLRSYLSMTEVNGQLKSLNDNINLLNQRVKVSVISGNSQPTVNNIPVIETNDDSLWKDGKPDPIDPERNDIRGDERVLLSSSEIEGVVGDVLNFDHGDIVDQSAPIIATKLNEEVDKIFESPAIDNELAFWFASPVDVEIKSPSGEILTKDENNIPLAKYSGESKLDGFKFVSIPNPVNGEYKIKLTGNGEGEYHAGSVYADYENDIPDQESEKDGTISAGEIKEYKISYDPQNINDPIGDIEPKDTTPPAIAIISPENKTYLNDNYALNFSSEISDDSSGVEASSVEKLLNSQPFEDESLDLSLVNLGSYDYQVLAKDKAGNSGSAGINFQITTNLDAIKNNINHYFNLGLIKKKIAKRYFSVRLKQLENLFNLLEKTKNSKLKPKSKQAAIDALKKVINMDIDIFIKQINRKSPRWIDPKAAGLLTESLKSMKLD